MARPEREQPAATLSPSEIEFVLRNAKRKTGPEVLRDLARTGDGRSAVHVQASSNKRSAGRA